MFFTNVTTDGSICPDFVIYVLNRRSGSNTPSPARANSRRTGGRFPVTVEGEAGDPIFCSQTKRRFRRLGKRHAGERHGVDRIAITDRGNARLQLQQLLASPFPAYGRYTHLKTARGIITMRAREIASSLSPA